MSKMVAIDGIVFVVSDATPDLEELDDDERAWVIATAHRIRALATAGEAHVDGRTSQSPPA